jgi:hypothetical protein
MKKLLGNVLLAALGLAFALGMVEILLRAFPNWVPPEIRVNPPSRRVKAFIDETYELKQSDGDLFHHMRGKILPISPEEDQMVARVHMITDANGFRNSLPEKATYGIVALGDSFTRASGVAAPWPQLVADHTRSDVLNLGDVGFGPQDELKVLQQYGLKKQPQWVIMAYFEGNDLYDAGAYDQATPFIVARFGRYIVDQSLKAWHGSQGGTQAEIAPNYRYPITVSINNIDLELAFFSYYVAWLSVNREEIESSQNYQLVRETILRVQELSEAEGARFLLVYVPSKEHVYLPYLKDDYTLASVVADVPMTELDEAGFIQFTSERAAPELILQNMDDQGNVLADFAKEHNIFYLDLTSTFQEEARTGAEMYYTFDTHWNQLGHDLAAEAISKYIEENLSDYSR